MNDGDLRPGNDRAGLGDRTGAGHPGRVVVSAQDRSGAVKVSRTRPARFAGHIKKGPIPTIALTPPAGSPPNRERFGSSPARIAGRRYAVAPGVEHVLHPSLERTDGWSYTAEVHLCKTLRAARATPRAQLRPPLPCRSGSREDRSLFIVADKTPRDGVIPKVVKHLPGIALNRATIFST